MKTKNIFIAVFALMLAACSVDPVEVNNTTIETAKWQKNYTIKAFLDTYMSEYGVYFPVRARSYAYNSSSRSYLIDPSDYTKNNFGLFSIDTVPEAGPDVVIQGRVISDDNAGNLYKVLVIQDSEDPRYALRISVDAGSVGALYPLGQLINVRVNGLGIGKYALEPQLCIPSYNANEYAYKSSEKMGWAPGRIPFPTFVKAVESIGMPEVKKIYVDTTLTIPQILDATNAGDDAIMALQGRLIRLDGIYFTNEYDDYGTPTPCTNGDPESDTNCGVFAPTTNNQGFPQSRYISDGAGNKILVSTSEYADFAHVVLPSDDYKGSVYGILGYYLDNARNYYVDSKPNNGRDKTKWQITIRSLDDLKLKDDDGDAWKPKEWGEK